MLTLNRYNAPDFQILEKVNLTKAQNHLLSNAIRLHWLHAGVQPVIRIELIFKAGTWYEHKRGVSYFTIKMMNEGTTTMTVRQINEYIDQFGAFIEFSHGQDKTNLTLYTVNKHLSKLLPLLKEITLLSIFPEKELQNIKNITVQNLQVNQEKTAYLAQTRFKEILFGPNHPYGKNLYEEDINAIQPDVLKDFYKKRVSSHPFDIILSGYVDEKALTQVRNIFEDIALTKLTEDTQQVYPAVDSAKEDVIEKADSLQSSIRMGRLLFTRNHPSYFKMMVLNEILGGYFGSRLMKNIREEKGLTYGISSNLATLQKSGYLVMGTDVRRIYKADY
jgi:predicted Zn-dependent peptidase